MKKQENKTTKTNFLTKFKNTKIGVKVIIIGGILALVATAIIVPIVAINGGDSSKQKPNVDNRENDNNEDDKKEDDNNEDNNQQDDNNEDNNQQDDNNEDNNQQDDNNEDNNQEDNNNEDDNQDDNNEDDNQEDDNQDDNNENNPRPNPEGVTDSYISWDMAYVGRIVTNGIQSRYDYINDQISTTKNTQPGNQIFKAKEADNLSFDEILAIGINKDEVLKNKNNDKIMNIFIKFLGYDFGSNKIFVNVFYQLKEDFEIKRIWKLYYETVEIIGFAKPKITPNEIATIAKEEFKNIVLHREFNVSSDLSTIGNDAFRGATFAKDAKFSLAQTKVKALPDNVFAHAKLPNGFALNDKITSIGEYAFYGAKFDKEAEFSLAQTNVKSISTGAFMNAKLPNAFALNDETTTIGENAFWSAYLNPGFKIPETIISIAQNSFLDAILPSGYGWYDKDGNKQKITATNYPYPGWYVGKI